MIDQLRQVHLHIDGSGIRLQIELLMNEGHGVNPVLTALYGLERFSGQKFRLGFKEAGDGLQVVLDPMMDLFDQPFLFRDQVPQGAVLMADLFVGALF